MSDDLKGFARWWHETGSGVVPLDGDDLESHTRRIACMAWIAGRAQMIDEILELPFFKPTEQKPDEPKG